MEYALTHVHPRVPPRYRYPPVMPISAQTKLAHLCVKKHRTAPMQIARRDVASTLYVNLIESFGEVFASLAYSSRGVAVSRHKKHTAHPRDEAPASTGRMACTEIGVTVRRGTSAIVRESLLEDHANPVSSSTALNVFQSNHFTVKDPDNPQNARGCRAELIKI